ncbi:MULTISPECIES: CHAT domain-containing protein [Streptacidiphilus]|uniref:CHAT domain-containing protein n=1 Tax=Streptacidiphilus cavernicola TaxID=3342716 RepID=A0ABV6UUW8_9ACTN|nr:CHAT domain-containing protein [Streptacidiphilus jeojiense]
MDQESALYDIVWGMVRHFFDAFERSAEPRDLDVVLTAYQTAQSRCPSRSAATRSLALDLMTALVDRFESLGTDLSDLAAAIAIGEELRGGSPQTGEDADSALLLALAHGYRLRAQVPAQPGAGDGDGDGTGDLDRAADLAEQVIAQGPVSARADAQASLGVILTAGYRAGRGRPDLERALGLLVAALSGSRDPSAQLGIANDLAGALHLWFGTTGDIESLDRAVELMDQVAGTVADDDPQAPVYLVNLGVLLATRGERTGSEDDLDRGVATLNAALALLPPEGVRAAHARSLLAEALRIRSLRGGGRDDSGQDDAVEAARASVEASAVVIGSQGAPELHLANALAQRYLLHGELADLDEAVRAVTAAVSRTPAAHPRMPSYLTAQANLLVQLNQRTEEPDLLDRAVDAVRRAVDLTAEGSPDLDALLSNLAYVLRLRYLTDHDRTDDLAQALAAAERAVALDPDRAHLTGARLNLANVRHLVYEHNHNPWALPIPDSADARDAAYRAAEAAVPEQPGHDAVRARALLVLGMVAEAHHRYEADPAALSRAVSAYRDAARTTGAPILVRALAAADGGVLAAERRLWDDAAECLDLALDLLGPLTEPTLLGWESRELQIKKFSGLAAAACAVQLERDRPDLALAALDRGRGILLAPAWGMRSEAERLPVEQAERYHALIRASFEDGRATDASFTAAPPPGSAEATEDGAARRRRARANRELLTDPAVRTLYPPTDLDRLRPLLGDGAAVSINLDDSRCDALILTAQGVQSLRLPELTHDDALGRARRFLEAVENPTATAVDDAHEMTEWLWDVLAGPVLERLGHRGAGGAEGRVWWIPTGALSLLPLHAAGHHREQGRPRTVLDRVVSSYSATLRALARDLGRTPARGSGPALVVAPGRGIPAPLADAIRLTGPAATRRAVLDHLPDCAVVHFSCHGRADPDSPADSFLRLHDGPLRFADIAGQDLPKAWLAFLAACETAVPGEETEDEAIHLCSAFQLAGFPHVIGTLWQVLAETSADVTLAVHTALQQPGTPVPPALAVHRAVHAARDVYADAGPIAWGGHVHFGP